MLFVDRQNDVSLLQQPTLEGRLPREQTLDADDATLVGSRVQVRNVKTEAEATQTFPQDHFVCVF